MVVMTNLFTIEPYCGYYFDFERYWHLIPIRYYCVRNIETDDNSNLTVSICFIRACVVIEIEIFGLCCKWLLNVSIYVYYV